MIQPFRIDAPDTTLDGIRARVREYPWHQMPDDGGWVYGTNLDYMKELCAYWLDEFDWRTHEAAINRFSHYTVPLTVSTCTSFTRRAEEGGRLLSPDGRRVEVPTAAALFPAELLSWPPRSHAERIYNIARRTEMTRGGHFAALAQPALLIEDIWAFARTCVRRTLLQSQGTQFLEDF
jgi:hypothetical protein